MHTEFQPDPTAELMALATQPGIRSALSTSWNGAPLQGICLVENSLDDGPQVPIGESPPVVLVSAVFDPLRGEYSRRLVRMLLEKHGFSRVYETRYLHKNKIGLMEPYSVTNDFETLCSDPLTAPLFVALCGGVPCLSEAMLRLNERGQTISASGALLIAPVLLDQLNLRGWLVYQSLLRPLPWTRRTCAAYTGHPHVSGNMQRLAKWYRSTLLRSAFARPKLAVECSLASQFPMAALYFERDLLSRRGRERLACAFSVKTLSPGLPGSHGSLYSARKANALIAGFCESVAPKDASC